MTLLRCDCCGRDLAGDTTFCPYCGADRRPSVAAVVESAPPAVLEPAREPPAPAGVVPPTQAPAPAPAAPPPADPPTAKAATETEPRPRRKARRGCATPLLVVLIAILVGVSWCTLRRGPTGGAPAVAGAIAAEPLRVSRHWRTVRLPGDAPANARFAVSSDTALRVRVDGRVYAVRPGHPLRLPEEVGESMDLRAADYVSAEDAAKAKAALSTLRGG